MSWRSRFDPKWQDDAEHYWVPDASDRATRYALLEAVDALEDYANDPSYEALKAAEEFFRLSADGVMSDLGVV